MSLASCQCFKLYAPSKILSASAPPSALQMARLEGVPPSPLGRTGVKDVISCKGVAERRVQVRFEITRSAVF